jgi:hypothetical protein
MPTYSSTSGNEYVTSITFSQLIKTAQTVSEAYHPLGVVSSVYLPLVKQNTGPYSRQIVYEPRAAHKGDAARALLYMMLRYDDINGKNGILIGSITQDCHPYQKHRRV